MKAWLKGGLIGAIVSIICLLCIIIYFSPSNFFEMQPIPLLYFFSFSICGFLIGVFIKFIIINLKESREHSHYTKEIFIGILVGVFVSIIFVISYGIFALNNVVDNATDPEGVGMIVLLLPFFLPMMFIFLGGPIIGICALIGFIIGKIRRKK